DQSIWGQYWTRLRGAVHGDFGMSLTQNLPVRDLIQARIGQTLLLTGCACTVSMVLGLALAYLATFVRWNPLRLFLTRLPALGASFPQFFIALMLIQFLSFKLGLFPAMGNTGWKSLVMPVATISVLTSSVLAQVLIKSFDDTLRQPYIVTARAKGLSRSAVHLKHALRNAALPAMTILGLVIGLSVTSSIIVETIYTRVGIGRLAQEAVLSQDVPVVLAVVTIAAAIFVTVNLIVDLLYPLLDPRIARNRGRVRVPAAQIEVSAA
ncbi:MAG: binding-protein-dependent transport system inner rane component, partial [Jatrophihabitantaceae bacterium]|nr:binding-protein-dependent transport system inner rane component [Jatrophihabitantaceae bacterium]